ncbi:hypothetical protein [Streptomyces spiralis]|uniref:hypothetical protein n=1 Tax=Streptomyces spiralis TaxID=66376 RepID=UPI001677EE16
MDATSRAVLANLFGLRLRQRGRQKTSSAKQLRDSFTRRTGRLLPGVGCDDPHGAAGGVGLGRILTLR